ncbi:MAG: hypothetical protein E6051_20085 [Citrobacter freundii]|uniref:hypothetical protein n=1 Tax=Citrobacter freundii TaxID=546 RepID=UPI00290BFEBD|nr:hypothetical protein [Citrobacter freundii]
MIDRNIVLINTLTRRTMANVTAGGDGFISTGTLSFDVGLNTRTIRRMLDSAVELGEAERRSNGPGKSYSYRIREVACS